MPAGRRQARIEILKNPRRSRSRPPGPPHHREDRPARLLREFRHQACAAEPPSVRRGARAGHRFTRTQARTIASPRRWRIVASLRSDPRQQVAERAADPRRPLDISAAAGRACGRHRSRLARAFDVTAVTHVINYEMPGRRREELSSIASAAPRARAGAFGRFALRSADSSGARPPESIRGATKPEHRTSSRRRPTRNAAAPADASRAERRANDENPRGCALPWSGRPGRGGTVKASGGSIVYLPWAQPMSLTQPFVVSVRPPSFVRPHSGGVFRSRGESGARPGRTSVAARRFIRDVPR